MRLRSPLFLIAAVVCFFSLPARAAVVEICNQGDTTLYVASAVYSKSVFFGNSYQVTGWYAVDADKCEAVYSATDPEDVYFGFTYHDSKDVLRTYITHPHAEPDNFAVAVSEKFCAAVGKPFDYKTQTKGGACADGYEPLEFSMYIGLSGGDYGRASYVMMPHRSNDDGDPFGGPMRTATLMGGADVQLVANTWQLSSGVALSHEYINPSTNLPPIAPKQQYAADRDPVAAYTKHIIDVLKGMRPCSDNSTDSERKAITHSDFRLDDRGVVTSYYSQDGEGTGYSVAVGNLDLTRARAIDVGDCWKLEIYCKAGDYCAERGATPDGSASLLWALYANNQEQLNTILNALKQMVPYYPDTTPDIREVK